MLKFTFGKSIPRLSTRDQKWMQTVVYPDFISSTLSVCIFTLIVIVPVLIIFDCLVYFFIFDIWLALSIVFIIEIIFFLIFLKLKTKISIISKLDTFLYFNIYTKKGKAITRKQFKKIKKEYPELYTLISSQKVAGQCYAVSFELLKLLKEGNLIFLAVDDDDPNAHKNTNYHMHTLYLNKGYVFDTNFSLQIPYEDFLTINKVRIFKVFSYKDVKDVDFLEFRTMLHPQLVNWCEENQIFLWSTCPVVE